MLKNFFLIGLMMLSIGAGCEFAFPEPIDDAVVEEMTRAFIAEPGMELQLVPTIVGLPSQATGFIDDTPATVVSIESYVPGGSAAFFWTNDASEPIKFETTAFADSVSVFLPDFWLPEERSFDDNSLLWLSDMQFQELKENSTTQLRPGFTSKLFDVLETRDRVTQFVQSLGAGETEEASAEIFALDITKTSTYPLVIDGEKTRVRSIETENWFGRFTILDNPDHPIILKATLNPLSIATVSSVSEVEVFDGVRGYHVAEITRNTQE